jgi:glycerophosphoryl diester phosphodiesterase
MASQAFEPQRGSFPGLGRPAVIAHAAGNASGVAKDAIANGADLVEVDLWVHGNTMQARHERALYPLPVFFEKWYLRIAPRRPFDLTRLLTETAGDTPVFLDLKNGPGEVAARLIRRALNECGPGEVVFASSQLWHVLRAVRREAPQVALLYSVDVAAKLALFKSVARREPLARGLSCNERLLTRAIVRDLKCLGILVVAWTVDDLDRVRELLSWGVDAITTHRVAETRALVEDLG